MTAEQSKAALLAGVGARVRALRIDAGLNVRQLADRARLSRRFINQLEAGSGNISIAGLGRVAAGLGRSIVELVPPPGEDRSTMAEAWRLFNSLSADDLNAFQEWIEKRVGARSKPGFVAFIGLRGAGKSTVAPLLAKQLKMKFVEVDFLIEQAAGMSLGEIFTLHGEQYYRRLERTALTELLSRSPACVLAPGGSVVKDAQSWELIKRRCFTVWLHATPNELMRRMRRQGDMRPMQGRPAAMDELKALLARREPLYAESKLKIDTTNKTPLAVVAQILKTVTAGNASTRS